MKFAGSLKVKLLLPYVLLILLLTLAIGWLSWWAGSRTVSELSDRLLSEMAERIAQAVDRHMYGSSAVLETAFPEGMVAPQDIREELPALRTRFYTAASLFTDPNDYVYYGNTLGQSYGVKVLRDGSAEARVKTEADAHRDYYHFRGIYGEAQYLHTEESNFDPRLRPWFRMGRDAPHHTWTAVYVDFGTGELVVTRARQVTDGDGRFAGVVATDLFLSELNRFIGSLAISLRSRAFIVEPGGGLIAASSVPNVRQSPDGRIDRVTAEDSGDPLVRAAWREMVPVLAAAGDAPGGQAVRSLVMDGPDGEAVHVALKRIRDDAGLDWYALIAVPDRDLLADVRETVVLVTVAGLLAMLVAAGIGLYLFGRVARDVSDLSRVVRRVGHGEFDVPLQVQRDDELGDLTRSFIEMRRELFTDSLTGAANRSALEQMLERLLRDREWTRVPFALLFIDLNRFKPLNDRYGHDNGDRALIEVSGRMQRALRDEDLLVRLGGDEFVVLLRHAENREMALAVGARLTAELERPLETLKGIADGEPVNLGASIGIACYPDDGENADTLLKCADAEMYRQKQRDGEAQSR